jgi:hypothetical protein
MNRTHSHLNDINIRTASHVLFTLHALHTKYQSKTKQSVKFINV